MKIWLDDERTPPRDFVGVSTPEMAIKLIELAASKGERIEILSLDHDLGLFDPETLEERTGYDVLCWLEKNPDLLPREVIIHSANPVGRRRMKMVLDAIERRNKK